MIRWGGTLKDDDISAVADFIVSAQEVPPNAIRPIPDRLTTKDYVLNVEKLVDADIHTPWGIEFVDAHRALITERTGAIRWMVDGKLDPQPIQGLPKTYSQNTTGGFMDIALDPAFSKNGWVYFAFSHTNGNPSDVGVVGMTNVVRGRINGHQWTDEQTLFEIPKDNPFVGKKGALPALFTIGNRNVQGIAQHPVTGEIWATEHGPMGGDELNILKKGANYGWPVITYGVDYDGQVVSKETTKEGMEQPVVQWTPSIAVCPAEFITSALFPMWKNNLLVGALSFEEIRRLVIENNKVIEQELILKGVGRVRDLKTGPDGAFYILLNDPDMVLRISPEKKH